MKTNRRNVLTASLAALIPWKSPEKTRWRHTPEDPPPTARRASIEVLRSPVNGGAVLMTVEEASDLCVVRTKTGIENGGQKYNYMYATWKKTSGLIDGEKANWLPTAYPCFLQGASAEWMSVSDFFLGDSPIIILQEHGEGDKAGAFDPDKMYETVLKPYAWKPPTQEKTGNMA